MNRLTAKSNEAATRATGLSAVANRNGTQRAHSRAAEWHRTAAILYSADGNREAAIEHAAKAADHEVQS